MIEQANERQRQRINERLARLGGTQVVLDSATMRELTASCEPWPVPSAGFHYHPRPGNRTRWGRWQPPFPGAIARTKLQRHKRADGEIVSTVGTSALQRNARETADLLRWRAIRQAERALIAEANKLLEGAGWSRNGTPLR